ncbi:UNVERIFIED_CONTAM: protein DCL, chloroplastic [Sesamum angustifolium]|uniref:Protein DCL, chloroplastic n=1 Tax=Sesamum angustifolium TaxID=2727405 RepID=A0AAW2LXN6_9LAMI
MALISASNSPNIRSFHRKRISKNLNLCPFSLSFPLCKARLCAINTGSDEGGSAGNSRQTASYGADLLRKPVVASPPADDDDGSSKEISEDDESGKKSGDGDTWVDWEDQILEDTVPLVGFVRMILHSGKYESGDRLSPEHERMILERLLPYHPESEKKIGCGVDYITLNNLMSLVINLRDYFAHHWPFDIGFVSICERYGFYTLSFKTLRKQFDNA